MAIDSGRVKEYEALQIAKQWESLARNAGQQLAISMADPLPPEGDTGRHSPKPGQKPSSPYEKGKSPHTIQAGLRINPNTILLPKEPAPAESDDDYGEGDVQGHPDWKLSHGKYFDEYGQPIQDPTKGMDPSGNPITIPHLQQTPEEAEQNRQLHIQKYHQAGIPEYDLFMQNMRRGSQNSKSGSIKHHPPHIRKLILGIGKRIRA